jgi:hypothetical protein
MKRIFQVALLLVPFATLMGQEPPKEGHKAEAAASNTAAVPHHPQRTAYRVDVRLFEVQDGKRINQREFSMVATASESDATYSNLRVGTRVPVNTGDKQTYLDVGFEGRCRLTDLNGKLFADLAVEVTSFAVPEPGQEPHGTAMPVLRSTRLNTASVLVPGKPQLIGSIDDLNSKKRVQVEVVATRIE